MKVENKSVPFENYVLVQAAREPGQICKAVQHAPAIHDLFSRDGIRRFPVDPQHHMVVIAHDRIGTHLEGEDLCEERQALDYPLLAMFIIPARGAVLLSRQTQHPSEEPRGQPVERSHLGKGFIKEALDTVLREHQPVRRSRSSAGWLYL